MSGEALNGEATTILAGRRRGEPSPGTVPSSTLENLTSKTLIVVHVGEDGADEPDHGGLVRENAHHPGPPLVLLLHSLERVGGPHGRPVAAGEGGEGEDFCTRTQT